MILFMWLLEKISVFPILEIFTRKNMTLYTQIFHFILSYFIIIGTSNTVNLSDGLDRLAITFIISITARLTRMSYLSRNTEYSNYFNRLTLKYFDEIKIFCTIIIRSGLGFLWFNTVSCSNFYRWYRYPYFGWSTRYYWYYIKKRITFFYYGRNICNRNILCYNTNLFFHFKKKDFSRWFLYIITNFKVVLNLD